MVGGQAPGEGQPSVHGTNQWGYPNLPSATPSGVTSDVTTDGSIVLHSRLPLVEVRARLQERVLPRPIPTMPPSKYGLKGTVRGDVVRLGVTRPYANTWAAEFAGSLSEEAGGTRIAGRMQLHPLASSFTTLWRLGLASLIVSSVVEAITDRSWDRLFPWIIGAIALLGLGGFGLPWLGRRLARNDPDEIKWLLADMLDVSKAGS